MPYLLVLTALWSLVEIAGLIAVGRLIGILATIAAVILSAVLGAVLLRFVGVRVLMATFSALQTGKRPDLALAHAGLTALGGFLLMLPGFLSDLVGLALFLPPVRSAVIALVAWIAGPVVVVETRGGGTRPPNVVDLDPDEWRHGGTTDTAADTAAPRRLEGPESRRESDDGGGRTA